MEIATLARRMSPHASDVLVVGAGIVGLCAAHELAERGLSVCVLDRETPAEGASCGNAGLVSYGHPPLTRPGASWRGLRWMFDRTSPLLVRPRLRGDFLRWMWTFHRHCRRDHFDRCMDVLAMLGRASLDRFDAVVDAAGDCGYRREGWLDVFASRASLDASGEEASMLDRLGYPSEPWSGATLRSREPAYRDEVAGARHYALAATLDPRRLVAGLVRSLEARGVSFRFGVDASRLLASDDRVLGVSTAAGEELRASTTVIAAGTWSDRLAALVGLRLPMQGARGYHLEFEGVDPLPSIGAVLHETFVAVTTFHGRLRLAGTLELGSLDRPWMRERLEQLPIGAARYLRGLDGAARVAEWAGYRPCLADGMPAIGFAPRRRGLVVATGHAMMGVTLGPATGRLVADLVTAGRSELESPMLAPGRFG